MEPFEWESDEDIHEEDGSTVQKVLEITINQEKRNDDVSVAKTSRKRKRAIPFTKEDKKIAVEYHKDEITQAFNEFKK